MSQGRDPVSGRTIETSDRGTLRYVGTSDLDDSARQLPGAVRASTKPMSEGHWRERYGPGQTEPRNERATRSSGSTAAQATVDQVAWEQPSSGRIAQSTNRQRIQPSGTLTKEGPALLPRIAVVLGVLVAAFVFFILVA